MIKKALYILLIAATASCVSTKNNTGATVQENDNGNIVANDIANKENKATTDTPLWGKLLSEACKEIGNENICLSPLSAQFAMAMVANGAEGKTREEICDVMQFGDSANERCREFIDHIATKRYWDKHSEIKIANSIWVKENFDVKQEFTETNKKYFDALVETAEFNRFTVERINNWCKENTNGKIPAILNRFNESDRMLLINALYFKAAWSKPFSEENTTNKRFTTEKGEDIEVPTMTKRSSELFYKDDVVTIVVKRLQPEYSMLFVLPNEGVKCNEAAEHLAKDFDTILKNMEVRDISLSLPKFTTDFGMSLKPILANLGIKRAFGDKAQFGGISNEALFISDIIQKAYINVNEKGTEAAAVTVIFSGALSSRPPKIEIVDFDRPFIYAIIKDNSNEVLFTGKVGNPAIK